jgi:hypothetical protein
MASEESQPAVIILKTAQVAEVELDEMWSCVGRKKQPRWLWEALDHQMGRVLAYVFGRREAQAFLKLKGLLALTSNGKSISSLGKNSSRCWELAAITSLRGTLLSFYWRGLDYGSAKQLPCNGETSTSTAASSA